MRIRERVLRKEVGCRNGPAKNNGYGCYGLEECSLVSVRDASHPTNVMNCQTLKESGFLYLLGPFPSSSHISNTLILCPVTPAVLLHPHVFRTSYLCCNGVDEILDCLAVNSHLVLIIQSTKIIERSVAHIMVSQKIRQFS